MFRKKFVALLLVMFAGIFSLNAAPSKPEAQKMIKNIIEKEWHKSFFASSLQSAKAFNKDGSWKYISELHSYAVFHPTKITEKSGRVSISGYFEDCDGLEADNDVYSFVFAKRSGKLLIVQVFYTDKDEEKNYKYNFSRGKMEELPDVEW